MGRTAGARPGDPPTGGAEHGTTAADDAVARQELWAAAEWCGRAPVAEVGAEEGRADAVATHDVDAEGAD